MSFKFELRAVTPNALDLIEEAGRICYDSPMNKETQEKFIAKRVKEGHESILEHASATFVVDGLSRSYSHQQVRHRLASYSQQSQRYVKAEDFEYVTPETISNKPEIAQEYHELMNSIKAFYTKATGNGVPAEDARMALPNACCTKIMFTMNFRSLRNFIKLRADKHAQWEIRKLATEILLIMNKSYRCCFEDLMEKFEV